MTRLVRFCAMALLGLAAGCSGGPVAETRYYTLRPPTGNEAGVATEETTAATGGEGLAVGVESIVVDPPYDQDRLVFRAGAQSVEVGFYNYHRWASPLSQLTATALAEGLRGTPGIATIEPAASGTTYGARLGGRLIYLEEVDRSGAQEVRVALDLELRDPTGRVIWSERLIESSTVDVESVPEIVREAQVLFARLLERAGSEIAAALSTD